jgi:ABC-type phosphate/phosphonate transport system substrate-binding protein
MIASLPMYDWPEVQAETDVLWESLRDHLLGAGIDAPATLARGGDPWTHWLNPSLALSQTCGLPFSAKLTGKTVLLGAPDYDLAESPKGTYRSVVIARTEGAEVMDLRGAKFAYNMRESQSGWAALDKVLSIEEHFGELVQSGAHRNSIISVAEGHSDCASIDAVSWALAQKVEPAAAQVHAIAVTPPTPGLPFITGQANDGKAKAMAEAISLAIAALPASIRSPLHLRGFKEWTEDDYAPLAAGWPKG